MASSWGLDGPQDKTLSQGNPFCLVSFDFLSIGRKGAWALPPKDDLVLYHRPFVGREQQNQPLEGL
jgi:hypothetical protein